MNILYLYIEQPLNLKHILRSKLLLFKILPPGVAISLFEDVIWEFRVKEQATTHPIEAELY